MIENKVQEPKTLAETIAEAERRIARQNSAIDLINTNLINCSMHVKCNDINKLMSLIIY
jgi:uncharacterized coiled-coil protein SlyX